MLPKAKRLSRSDFLKRPVRSVQFPFGSIKIIEGGMKAAVVISKKIVSSAAKRNLLRRRMYAILRSHAGEHSLIVYPNKKALIAPFSELKQELERALAHC